MCYRGNLNQAEDEKRKMNSAITSLEDELKQVKGKNFPDIEKLKYQMKFLEDQLRDLTTKEEPNIDSQDEDDDEDEEEEEVSVKKKKKTSKDIL